MIEGSRQEGRSGLGFGQGTADGKSKEQKGFGCLGRPRGLYKFESPELRLDKQGSEAHA